MDILLQKVNDDDKEMITFSSQLPTVEFKYQVCSEIQIDATKKPGMLIPQHDMSPNY